MDANTIWQEIREHLEREKRQLVTEIREYPAPIPACDAQFNHLMQQRARITRELGRLQAAKRGAAQTDMLGVIEEFIESSLCLEPAAKAMISRRLRDQIIA